MFSAVYGAVIESAIDCVKSISPNLATKSALDESYIGVPVKPDIQSSTLSTDASGAPVGASIIGSLTNELIAATKSSPPEIVAGVTYPVQSNTFAPANEADIKSVPQPSGDMNEMNVIHPKSALGVYAPPKNEIRKK